jgi:hypothetical protein
MRTMTAVRALAIARAVVGATFAFRTEKMLRLTVRDAPPTGALFAFAQTVGVRDLVFGLGALVATRDGETDEAKRWLKAWLVSDVGDVVAGATGSRHLGRAGAATAATVPLPFIAAGLWALRRLSAAEQSPSA